MVERLPHLRFARAQPVNDRRRSPGFGLGRPDHFQRHARELGNNLDAHQEVPQDELPGFDSRHLLKLEIEGIASDELANIPEFSIVSEEGNNFTVLFATEAALRDFRSRLERLEAGEHATREQILFAVKRFDYISAEDRRGQRLRNEGIPDQGPFVVDVELWVLDLRNERDAMIDHFVVFCNNHNIEIRDFVNHPSLVLYRVHTTTQGLDRLLHLRDVRRVDLPPQYDFEIELLDAVIGSLPTIEPPPDDAPTLAVLDSGIAAGHPLLEHAIGDAQSFINDDDPTDPIGHGTTVAGHALLGDVANVAQSTTYSATLRILSGKIGQGRDDATLLENRIKEAVQYFTKNYSCRVFNLSIGVFSRPYTGGHVDRLAATIDWLSREYQVLFVVSAGNVSATIQGPANWREAYPRYLLGDEFRILDPAPALNAITVGAIANYEVARMAARNPDDPAYQPIAKKDQPAPFTLGGPGPNNAIKPDFVDYGGNRYIDSREAPRPAIGNELGELGLSKEFATGNIYRVAVGTSYAAPRVAHNAVHILQHYPDASPSLIRALMAAHATVPDSCTDLDLDQAEVRRLVGYGRPNSEHSLFSERNRVTLIAEEQLAPNEHHFFEIPMPDDLFTSPSRRPRRITVAIAHTPRVRRTRLKYRESEFSFRVVKAENLDAVTQAYRRLRRDEKEDGIQETGFTPSPTLRKGGTLQCATRIIGQIDNRYRRKPYHLVVTNSVPNWVTSPESEPYSLVVVIEDQSGVEVDLYTQVRVELEARERARARA